MGEVDKSCCLMEWYNYKYTPNLKSWTHHLMSFKRKRNRKIYIFGFIFELAHRLEWNFEWVGICLSKISIYLLEGKDWENAKISENKPQKSLPCYQVQFERSHYILQDSQVSAQCLPTHDFELMEKGFHLQERMRLPSVAKSNYQ